MYVYLFTIVFISVPPKVCSGQLDQNGGAPKSLRRTLQAITVFVLTNN